MVIPWLGFSLSELLNKVQIKPSAKFVEFETVYNPEEMVGQRYPVLNWPYIEGFRLDEAMHPLNYCCNWFIWQKNYQIKMGHL